jgi:HK97 family phage major capsid protein
MKILELREKRSNLWNAAKTFLDSKRGADGMVSPEAAAEYEKMETDMVNLGKEIDRLERQAAYDLELNAATSQAVTNTPATTEAEKTGRASNQYRDDFRNVLRGRAPIHNVLSTTPDADGGYLVPTEFERRIVMGLEEANVIRSIAKVITTSSERKIPIADTHSTAQWTTENAAIPESQPKFTQKTIDAFKLTNLIRISTELLQDSMFDLEGYIAAEFARAFGIAEEQAFCVGTGTGQPSGIFLESGGGEIGTTTTGATINTDHLIDLVYALKSPYRRNAVFLMRDITVSAIRKLKDSNGQYLWQPSVQAGEPDRLLGYKLYTSPYVPTIEAGALPVAFGDFSHYWIADRMGRTVQRLIELYAGNGQIGFIGTQRVDAKVILPEGIKLLKMGGA